MIADRFVGELRQIKMDIAKWFTPDRNEPADGDPAKAYRNAEEVIWKFQERYGYIPNKQDLDQ